MLWCLPQFSCLFFFYQHKTDAAPDVEDADVCQFQNNFKFINVYGILPIPQFEEKCCLPLKNV